MPSFDIQQLGTVDLMRLIGNITVALREKAQEEYAGDELNQIMTCVDEISGCVGAMMELTEAQQSQAVNPDNMGPSTPAAPQAPQPAE